MPFCGFLFFGEQIVVGAWSQYHFPITEVRIAPWKSLKVLFPKSGHYSGTSIFGSGYWGGTRSSGTWNEKEPILETDGSFDVFFSHGLGLKTTMRLHQSYKHTDLGFERENRKKCEKSLISWENCTFLLFHGCPLTYELHRRKPYHSYTSIDGQSDTKSMQTLTSRQNVAKRPQADENRKCPYIALQWDTLRASLDSE